MWWIFHLKCCVTIKSNELGLQRQILKRMVGIRKVENSMISKVKYRYLNFFSTLIDMLYIFQKYVTKHSIVTEGKDWE